MGCKSMDVIKTYIKENGWLDKEHIYKRDLTSVALKETFEKYLEKL